MASPPVPLHNISASSCGSLLLCRPPAPFLSRTVFHTRAHRTSTFESLLTGGGTHTWDLHFEG